MTTGESLLPQGILLDMDGVLWHGERVLPGARSLLEAIAGRPHLFVTNNPTRLPEAVAARMAALGLPRPDPGRVLTSGVATGCWLAARCPGFRFLAVGAPALAEALRRAGGREDPEHAEFVVVGEGPGLDHAILTRGIARLLAGAELVSTNPDATVDAVVDGRHCVLPGGGALVAPFEVAAGRRAVTIGKPEPLLFRLALERLGLPPAACVMIGDRPDTDLLGAARTGIGTVLVRTGRFAPGAPWPAEVPMPDLDVPDLPTLLDIWGVRRS